MKRFQHDPVLLEEILDLLAPAPGAQMVDATVGLGGHAQAMLERSSPDGRLLGLDRDPEALRIAAERLARFGERVTLVRSCFGDLDRVLADQRLPAADVLLVDLGMSSLQLDDLDRGFRFAEAEAERTPLDMRMDPDLAVDAAALLAQASEQELVEMLRSYGEMPGAHRLARTLVQERRTRPLRTAADLLRVIRQSGVGRGRRHHPATLVFQALRIAVNDELRQLGLLLDVLPQVLAAGGRLAILSYHSLEDRAVKHRLRELERGCICPPVVPVCRCGRRPLLRILTRRPITASADEVRRNPRARSARLRVAARRTDAA